ncbi:MAG TPA: hypothetical protein VFR81_05275 [Longimicrobium sp.]|nr:hypothetical protein [Longimicrobium sp.]
MDELWFCGEVSAPDGLGALAPRLAGLSWPVEVWRSGFDGSEVLRAWKDPVHLDMEAGQGAGGLFSGTVDADHDTALRLLAELSDALREAGMRHRIELYDGTSGPLLDYLHHRWPRTE